MTDPMDQPEDDTGTYSLVVPFVVCTSQGGPYDDDSFVAGFMAGDIDRALRTAEALGAGRMRFTVRTALLKQLELIAMNRGFPVMKADAWEDGPEWTLVTFESGVAS